MDNETHRAQIQANELEAERRQIEPDADVRHPATVVPGAIPYDAFKKLRGRRAGEDRAGAHRLGECGRRLPPLQSDDLQGSRREVNKRMLVALVALAGVFVALYLTLYKLGYIGTLVCAVGSCETVQTSKWATLPRRARRRVGGGVTTSACWPSRLAGLTPPLRGHAARCRRLLVAMTGFGVLFSLWLT